MNARPILLALLLAAATSAAAHPPVSVVVDRQGNAYYSDLQQVWKVTPDGKKTVAVPGVHTHELYLDAQGNLYGENSWYEGERTNKWGHYVWRRSPDGRVVKVIPDREGFLKNYSFVRDAAGNMYVPNYDQKRLERHAPNGTRTVLASNLDNIRWMTATPEGTVYLINNQDLVQVTPSGTARAVARKLSTRPMHGVMGLWTDRAGNVYAASHPEKQVKKVAPDGKVSVIATSTGTWSPVGGAFAPNGDLLLLEVSVTNAARLRRIPASGLRAASR